MGIGSEPIITVPSICPRNQKRHARAKNFTWSMERNVGDLEDQKSDQK